MRLKLDYLVTTVITFAWFSTQVIEASSTNTSEDANLNFTQLANKYGHRCDEYSVITQDKYNLTVFNIPRNTDQIVFLMHGLFDSADSFILRGNGSLAATLATAGFDVWVGNIRGNKYSRRHDTLNPDTDKKFWDFSFHEFGYYDIPAFIDFILQKTGREQLQAIAHSQGTTCFYVMAATRPEYNNKIKCLISLAPIAYVHHTQPPLSLLRDYGPVINKALVLLGMEEILRSDVNVREFMKIVCTTDILIGYQICVEGITFVIDGDDREEFGPDFLPTVVGHYPSGSSRKNCLHLSQVGIRKKFAYFDYGFLGNLAKYKSNEPPDYNLSNIIMPVALFIGKNDKISVKADVDILNSQLPNVVEYREMEREKFNHLDFVLGEHMYLYLFPSIFEVLGKYN